MDTGIFKSDGTIYSAPFQHQGTGTINTLVLSLLAMIADLKQNVIFAMEEPEIAIPPHTQKRIVESVRHSSAQAIFTSHSPYILEEFEPDKMIILQRNNGIVSGIPCSLLPNIKLKSYKEELRRRFCEALLARRVLITEGRTEYDAWVTSAKRLSQFDSNNYKSLSTLGIAVINAETDSQVANLGSFFLKLGKQVFAVFDKQSEKDKKKIEDTGITTFEAPEKGFENVILCHTTDDALRRFALSLVNDDDEWPEHLKIRPTDKSTTEMLKESLLEYFKWGKGSGTAAKFISQCESIDEIPDFIKNTLTSIIKTVFDKDNVQ
jgi:putative ATP-dependent endonuclease of OLD family